MASVVRGAISMLMSRSTAPFSAAYRKCTSRNATSPARPLDGARAAGRLRRHVQHLEHARAGRDALLQRAEHVDDGAQRSASRRPDAPQEGDEIPGSSRCSEHLPDRDVQHAGKPERRRRSARPDCSAAFVPMSRMYECRLRSLTASNTLRLVVLRVEDLDHALAIERFLRHARDVAHGVLDARAVAAETAG